MRIVLFAQFTMSRTSARASILPVFMQWENWIVYFRERFVGRIEFQSNVFIRRFRSAAFALQQ